MKHFREAGSYGAKGHGLPTHLAGLDWLDLIIFKTSACFSTSTAVGSKSCICSVSEKIQSISLSLFVWLNSLLASFCSSLTWWHRFSTSIHLCRQSQKLFLSLAKKRLWSFPTARDMGNCVISLESNLSWGLWHWVAAPVDTGMPFQESPPLLSTHIVLQ